MRPATQRRKPSGSPSKGSGRFSSRRLARAACTSASRSVARAGRTRAPGGGSAGRAASPSDGVGRLVAIDDRAPADAAQRAPDRLGGLRGDLHQAGADAGEMRQEGGEHLLVRVGLDREARPQRRDTRELLRRRARRPHVGARFARHRSAAPSAVRPRRSATGSARRAGSGARGRRLSLARAQPAPVTRGASHA